MVPLSPSDVLELILKLKETWDEVVDNDEDSKALTEQVHQDFMLLNSASYRPPQTSGRGTRPTDDNHFDMMISSLSSSLSECLRRCEALRPPPGHIKGAVWKVWNKGDLRKEIEAIQKAINTAHQRFTSYGLMAVGHGVDDLRQMLLSETQKSVKAGLERSATHSKSAVQFVGAGDLDKPAIKKTLKAVKKEAAAASHSGTKKDYLRLKVATLESLIADKSVSPQTIIRRTSSHSSLDIARNIISVDLRSEPLQARLDPVMRCLDAIEECNDGGVLSPAAAHSIGELSIALCQIGLAADARRLAAHAITVYRRLTDGDPNAYWPRLARALDVHAVILNSLNTDLKTAMECSWEASKIYHTLRNSSDAHRHAYAIASMNCSNALCALGKYTEALPYIERAVSSLRSLARQSPQNFASSLCKALNNLAECLSNLEDKTHAMTAINEAVALVRSEKETHPDIFTPTLATCLFTKAVCCLDLRHLQDGIKAMKEVIAVRRELYEGDHHRYGSLLSESLAVLCDLHKAADDSSPKALKAIEEAVAIDRDIRLHSDSRELRRAYASHLHRYSLRLSLEHAGGQDQEDALSVMKEAIEIRRQLAHDAPRACNPDLARSLHDFAVILYKSGQYERARFTIQKAIKVRSSLAQEDSQHRLSLQTSEKALKQIERALAAG